MTYFSARITTTVWMLELTTPASKGGVSSNIALKIWSVPVVAGDNFALKHKKLSTQSQLSALKSATHTTNT